MSASQFVDYCREEPLNRGGNVSPFGSRGEKQSCGAGYVGEELLELLNGRAFSLGRNHRITIGHHSHEKTPPAPDPIKINAVTAIIATGSRIGCSIFGWR